MQISEDLFLGVDIGGTITKIGIVNSSGSIIHKQSVMTQRFSTTDEFLEVIFDLIKSVLTTTNTNTTTTTNNNILSIGIGVPGIISSTPPNETVLISPNIPILCGANIGKYLREKLSASCLLNSIASESSSSPHIFLTRIVINNDANAAALAELHAGAGKKYRDFVYITLGTGVGGAIIINKKIYSGISGGAGEIGHMVINNSDICLDSVLNNLQSDYRTGVLEEIIGRESIIRLAQKNIINYPDSLLARIKNISILDVKDISMVAEQGDELAIKILKYVGYNLGIAIINLSHILDITNFVVGGGISAAEIIINTALEFARKRSLPTVANRISIDRAMFLEDTGIVGAAFLGASKYNI